MLPDRLKALQNVDFSDLLTATYERAPRNQVIKFNNSWFLKEESVTELTYLVAYRAMIFKCVLTASGLSFGGTKPAYPGDVGTPWGHGWRIGPAVAAPKEGFVPIRRERRFFDGVGIAQVTLSKADMGKPGYGLRVQYDQIIKNSDGYEDPRLFRYKDKTMLHVHRYHPDSMRAALRAEDYADIGHSEEEEWALEINGQRLCVKCVELLEDQGVFSLGKEYFYGLNSSESTEKNFGFFYEDERLNAVYGVSTKHNNLSILKETETRQCYIKTESMTGTPGRDDCFFRIEEYWRTLLPGNPPAVFSSSSPLVPNSKNSWIGLGHVKIRHGWPLFIMQRALNCMRNVMNLTKKEPVSARQLLDWTKSSRSIVSQAVAKSIEGLKHSDTLKEYTDTDFFESAIAPIFAELVCQSKKKVSCHLGKIIRLSDKPEMHVFLHGHCFYLSFLYEVTRDEEAYSLTRFSDAFLLTDLEDPHSSACFLQFATGLTRAGNDYLISYGENDHRSCMSVLPRNEVTNLLRHKPEGFSPKHYRLYIEKAKKVLLHKRNEVGE